MSGSKLEFADFFAIEQAEVILLDLEEYLCEGRKLHRGIQPKGDQTKWIDPVTRRNWRHNDKIRLLKQILASEIRKGTPERDIWVAFTQVDKLGVNPDADDGSTPLGIYAYPIQAVIDDSAKGGFKERPFAQVFKIRRTYSKSRGRKPAIYSTSVKEGKRKKQRPNGGYYSGSRMYSFPHLRQEVEEIREEIRKIKPDFHDILQEERKKIMAWAHQYLGIKQLPEAVDFKTTPHKEAILKQLEDKLGTVINKMSAHYANHGTIDPNKGILAIQADREMAFNFLQGMGETHDEKATEDEHVSALRSFLQRVDIDGHYDNWHERLTKYRDANFGDLTVQHTDHYLEKHPEAPETVSMKDVFDLEGENKAALNYFGDDAYGKNKTVQHWEKLVALRNAKEKKSGQSLQDVVQSEEWKKVATLVLRRLNKFVSNYKRDVVDPIINKAKFPFHQRIKKYAEANHLSWFNALYETLWNTDQSRTKNGAGFILWMASSLASERKEKKKKGIVKTSGHPLLGLGLPQAKDVGRKLERSKQIEKGKKVYIANGKYAGKEATVLKVNKDKNLAHVELPSHIPGKNERDWVELDDLQVKDIKAGVMPKGSKAKKWREWTAVLRGLGIDGFTDRQGWSVIHSGEPKQGVFFDSGSLIPIAQIDNQSHIDPRSPHGRPKIQYYDLMTQFKKKHGIDPYESEDIPFEKQGEWEGFLKAHFKKANGIPEDEDIPEKHVSNWTDFKGGYQTTAYDVDHGRFQYIREKGKQRKGREIDYHTSAGSLERTMIGIRRAIEAVKSELMDNLGKASRRNYDDSWQKIHIGLGYLAKIIQSFHTLSTTFEQKVLKGSIKTAGNQRISDHIAMTQTQLQQINERLEALIRDPKYQAWLHGPWRALRAKIDVVRNLIRHSPVNVPKYSSKDRPIPKPEDLQKLDILYPYHKQVSQLPDQIRWTPVKDLILGQIEGFGKDQWYALVKHQAARGNIGTQQEINDQLHRWDWFWNDENLQKLGHHERNDSVMYLTTAQLVQRAKSEAELRNLIRYQVEKGNVPGESEDEAVEKWLATVKAREAFEKDPVFKQIPEQFTYASGPEHISKADTLSLGKERFEKLIDYFVASNSISEKAAAEAKSRWAKAWSSDLSGIDLTVPREHGESLESLPTMNYKTALAMGLKNVSDVKRLAEMLLSTKIISKRQYMEALSRFHLLFKHGVPENDEIQGNVSYELYDYRLNARKVVRELELRTKPENKELAIKLVMWMLANNRSNSQTALETLSAIERAVKASGRKMPEKLAKYKMLGCWPTLNLKGVI